MKNKEALKNEMKEKMLKEIERYVDQMEQGFQRDKFDIGEIEKLWSNAIDGCKSVLKDSTEKMLNSVVEKDIISKKNRTKCQY